MTSRIGLLAVVVGLALLASGCASVQRAYDPNGRCLGWQLSVAAEVHVGGTPDTPVWDLRFKNTSQGSCVFGGVPSVSALAAGEATAGAITSAASLERAVPLGPGDVAYAMVTFAPSSSCKPVAVTSLRVSAPHVKGGTYVVKVPEKVNGCADGAAIGSVGQVTKTRSP